MGGWLQRAAGRTQAMTVTADGGTTAGGAPPGDRARWETVRVLWAGHKASKVLMVRDRLNPAGERFALKELNPQTSSTAVRRLAREIEITRTLSGVHPGIVPVLDFGVPGEGEVASPWYVMPLAECSLEKAERYRGDLLAVLELGLHLARTLAAAHEQGVIHRDLKPANLLQMSDGTVRIADFGIAFLRDEPERLTREPAGPVGTRPFLPPEMIRRGPAPVTTAVDVYSLGKTLYALVSGGRVPEREDHKADGFDLFAETGEVTYAHFHALLDRMIATEPAERFQDMSEVADYIERAVANIRAGAMVIPGMYGTAKTPLGIYRALKATLLSKAPGRRATLANAVDDAVEAAEEWIAATAPTETADSGNAGTDALDVAAKCGDFLLTAGAAALVTDDDDLALEWIARLRDLLEDARDEENRRRSLLHEAAASALIAAGGMAWRHESLECLTAVVEAYQALAPSIIFLPLPGGGSVESAKWVARSLRDSAVLAEAEPRVAEQAELMVGLLSGLALLRELGWTPPQRRAEILQEPQFIDPYPGLCEPFWGWFSEVGRRCRMKPHFAQRLGGALQVTSEGKLQKACARLHPVLMHLVRANRPGRGMFFEGMADPSGDWHRWLQLDAQGKSSVAG